ncbi:hypothetical protein [Streptomyces sp. NPDC007205]|uniref:hypothetical protein n=1 Tax=Streptomyces sp. NPDC007205 TaxID=3154316 RepID=UPI0033FE2B3D
MYASGLAGVWWASGLREPRLPAAAERADGDVALWLKDAPGEPATAWPPDRHVEPARRLGAAQRASRVADRPWLSRHFLHGCTGGQTLGAELLDDDATWRQPLVRDHFPAGPREEVVRLRHDRESFPDVLEALPCAFCRLDLWPANVVGSGPDALLSDWRFASDGGAPGEDLGNCVPDSVSDLFVPAPRPPGCPAAPTRCGGGRACPDGHARLAHPAMPAAQARSSSTTAAGAPSPANCSVNTRTPCTAPPSTRLWSATNSSPCIWCPRAPCGWDEALGRPDRNRAPQALS